MKLLLQKIKNGDDGWCVEQWIWHLLTARSSRAISRSIVGALFLLAPSLSSASILYATYISNPMFVTEELACQWYAEAISVSVPESQKPYTFAIDEALGIQYYGGSYYYQCTAWNALGQYTSRANIYLYFDSDCPEGYKDDGTGHCVKITLEKDRKQTPEICTGNPINVATGNKFQTESDYQSHTPFSLNFVRYYNSSSNTVDKGIGKKWRHGFNRAIKLVGNQAQVARSTGQTFLFNLDSTNNIWQGDVDISDTLVELVDETGVRTGWEYHDKNDNVELFNTAGQLISISNRAGQSKTFVYDVAAINGGDDNSDTLDKVLGFGGEAMLFGYDDAQRITLMTDPEGNFYSYNYDAAGNLESVVYPDDTPLDDSDNPTRTYHYENTSFPSHLTGLTDETESRVTWAFDSEGRAISSEMQGGVDKSTLDFSVADQVTVTNPLGKDTTYHFETLHGVKKVTKVEGHATESCAGANQNYSYDANGYIESKTDWQGNVTTYVHNERGLETSRTEASGTDEARTITTQWHDDFRLPLKVTSPGQVTNFVYDDKGRLLSQTTHDVQ